MYYDLIVFWVVRARLVSVFVIDANTSFFEDASLNWWFTGFQICVSKFVLDAK